MKSRVLSTAFNTGEVTPELFGRVDLEKVKHACGLARNFIVLPHGPLANRTGLQFVKEVKTSANFTRLVPFVYSQYQTFAIELGGGYFRFHTDGGTLLANGATVWSSTATYYPSEVVSYNGSTYLCLQSGVVGTVPGTNSAVWYLLPADGTLEIPNTYAAADLPVVKFIQSNDVMTFTHPSYQTLELRRYGAADWRTALVTFAPTLTPPNTMSIVANTPTAGGVATAASYVMTAVQPGTFEESGPSASVSATNNLTLQGNNNVVTGYATTYSSLITFNVYKAISPGGIYGFIGSVSAPSSALNPINFTDNNITPDFTQTPPIPQPSTLLNSATWYAACAAYYQQRKALAGPLSAPQSVWMTRSGTEYNMNYSVPVRNDDAIQFAIASREMNNIRHMIPLRGDLLLLTPDAEFQCTSTTGGALTPSTILLLPFSYIGASDAPPATAGNSIVYAQSRGGRVRELLYSWQAQGYVSNDVSILAPHLFDTFNVVDMAFVKAPYPIVWCVNDQGTLLGMSYVPEQQIAAWHHHDTGNGDRFEACCSVIENSDDVLYVIVNRTINGATRRFVERLVPRIFPTPADAFFVDSGATYQAAVGTYSQSGTTVTCTTATAHGLATGQVVPLAFSDALLTGSYTVTVVDTTHFTVASTLSQTETGTMAVQVTTVSGLTWLEGRTVAVLADGAVHPQVVVSATGSIALQWPANKLQIGLPITAQFEGMPFAFLVTWDDRGQGRPKNVNKAFLRVRESSGFYAGPSFSQLTQYAQAQPSTWGTPPAWVTDEVEVVVSGLWDANGQICVQQTDPLPVTLIATTLEVSVGGG